MELGRIGCSTSRGGNMTTWIKHVIDIKQRGGKACVAKEKIEQE